MQREECVRDYAWSFLARLENVHIMSAHNPMTRSQSYNPNLTAKGGKKVK
jgi:hypothetical protein